MDSFQRAMMRLIKVFFGDQGRDPPDGPGDLAAIPDPLLWSFNEGRHVLGRFSYAAVGAHSFIEDYSQVETDPLFTFIGIYDGHFGHEASQLISKNIYNFFLRNRKGSQITKEGLEATIRQTEACFQRHVDFSKFMYPLIKAKGSSCLIGIIQAGTLHIVNLGDSRAVVCVDDGNCNLLVEVLSKDHSASNPETREEFDRAHPEYANFDVDNDGIWRVKGMVQVTKSIGDFYMKKEEYTCDRSSHAQRKFTIAGPAKLPLLSADPDITSIVLKPEHKFIVFASYGLWKILSEEEVCEIVLNHTSRRRGVAESVIRKAIFTAALNKRGWTYDYVKTRGVNERISIHDDITVIVVYIDHLLPHYVPDLTQLSLRAFQPIPGQPDPEQPNTNIASTIGPNIASTSDIAGTSGSNVASSSSLIRMSTLRLTSGSNVASALNIANTSNVASTSESNVASTSNVGSTSESNVASTSSLRADPMLQRAQARRE